VLNLTKYRNIEISAEQAKEREKIDNFIPNLKATIKKTIDVLLDKIAMLESLLTAEQYEKYIEYCHSQKSN
jgi:hypothetical protein